MNEVYTATQLKVDFTPEDAQELHSNHPLLSRCLAAQQALGRGEHGPSIASRQAWIITNLRSTTAHLRALWLGKMFPEVQETG